jgi:RimJ/RimL family protein N-acetyltransferase
MPYRILSPRLCLRCWQPEDAPRLKAAVDENLEHLRPWMPWIQDEPTSLEEKLEFVLRCRGRFDLEVDFTMGVLSRDGSQVLGGCGLHDRVGPSALEIGYWIHGAHQGAGYATEAAGALTQIGFRVLGLSRLEIRCDPANAASARVADKLGYLHEVTRRALDRDVEGRPRDTMVWTMLRSDFEARGAPLPEVEAYDACGSRVL